jgi:ribosomal protein S18 acetylase RimI-like enzyme
VRRVRAKDWELLRELRLRALETDRASFGSTHERERAFPEEQWREWAEESSEGDSTATVFAFLDESAVDMVAAYRDEDQPALFHVIAMWVAPEARSRGVGRRLLAGIEAWISSCGGELVQLSVTNEAAAAWRLYELAGYEPDGTVEESPHTPGLRHESLMKPLQPRPAPSS